MKCPFCKRPLVPGPLKAYETLVDHVDEPNRRDYPLRPTYICGCLLSEGAFWDEMGDYYSYSSNLEHYHALKETFGDPLDHGNLHAIDSPSWRSVRVRRRREWLKKHIAPYRWYLEWRWRRVTRKYGLTA